MKENDILLKARVVLQRHPVVQKAEVLGSVARGDYSDDSDFDLIVEYSEKTSLFDHVELALDLEETLGRAVDIIDRACLNENIDVSGRILGASISLNRELIYEQ